MISIRTTAIWIPTQIQFRMIHILQLFCINVNISKNRFHEMYSILLILSPFRYANYTIWICICIDANTCLYMWTCVRNVTWRVCGTRFRREFKTVSCARDPMMDRRSSLCGLRGNPGTLQNPSIFLTCGFTITSVLFKSYTCTL